MVLALTAGALLSLREDTGEVLWRYTKVNSVNIPTPLFRDGYVFVSTREAGCALLKLDPRTMTEVYFNRDMKNHFSSSVLVGNTLYGYSNSILTAMDFKTGNVAWRNRTQGQGSLIYADQHLYTLSEDGVLALVEATPQSYKEVSRFVVDIGRRPEFCPFFSLPAIADGRLYLRIQDHLICYDIKARQN
jgi:outer membrane protein assembly factor BamB